MDQGASRDIGANLKSRICNLQSGEARRPSYLITVIFFDPAARPLTMI